MPTVDVLLLEVSLSFSRDLRLNGFCLIVRFFSNAFINRDQGQVLKVLSGGDFFGEIGILSLSEGQNR